VAGLANNQSFSGERPVWENQVMSPEDLHPGQVLNMLGRGYKGGYKERILILSKFYIQGGNCKYDFAFLDQTGWPSSEFIFTGFCSDAGLVHYRPGGWNEYNHLSYTGVEYSSGKRRVMLTPLRRVP
jgi:hypothetical protein